MTETPEQEEHLFLVDVQFLVNASNPLMAQVKAAQGEAGEPIRSSAGIMEGPTVES